MPTDAEHDAIEIQYVKGYPSLAAFIASDTYKSTFIYRRFDRLSARSLLYLQSELVELEAEQDALETEDQYSSTDELKGSRDWNILKARGRGESYERDQKRLCLVYEIRQKLKEYREALIRESTPLSLKRPGKRTLEAFRNKFMNADSSGENFPTLGGRSASILDDENELVTLRAWPHDDKLTSFLRRYFALFFVKRTTNSRLAYLSERRLKIVVASLYILLAATLLFGAVLNLYMVTDERKRLGLIAGYTTVFAMCLGLVNKAEGHQVFAACAAYSAVLVVFVSGNLGKTGKSGGAG
ncbi:MAG: hypothetical protein Q9201_003070 [Fulgogasparrea decipioides]